MAPKSNQAPIVRYKFLIERARNEGLTNIATELVQIPNAQNGNVAIARACVTFEIEGKIRTFEDYGDAAPNNVGPMVGTALIRMALTRAKARCLRDALGVGDAAAEEMSDYDNGESGSSAATANTETRPTFGKVNDSGSQCAYCRVASGSRHRGDCPSLRQAAA
jgi:hypothetical protein